LPAAIPAASLPFLVMTLKNQLHDGLYYNRFSMFPSIHNPLDAGCF